MAMHWSTPRKAGLTPAGFIEPCLPTQVDKPPAGPEWIHEIKHDGYRLLVRKRDDCVRLFTRRGFDWTHKFPLPMRWQHCAPARSRSTEKRYGAVPTPAWRSSTSCTAKLTTMPSSCTPSTCLSLMAAIGATNRLKSARKCWPRYARAGAGLRFNAHLSEDGAIVFRHASKLGAEGIVSKRRDVFYRSGRTKGWLKVKNPKSPAVTRIEEETW
jgi:bifunctional non-homologous end joining protein LigD